MKWLLICLTLPAAGPVAAGLLYYEGFDYPVAEDGLKYHGGFAATPDPASGCDADIAEGSLRYMDARGNALAVSGHHAVVDSHEETNTISNVAPVLRLPTQQPAGNEIWLSLVGRQTAGTTQRFFNVSLRAPDNTLQPHDPNSNMDEIIALGMPSGAADQVWCAWDRTTNGFLWTSAISQSASTELSLVVLRIELNAVDESLERYTLWVNPALGVPPPEDAGFSTVSVDSDFAAWSDLEQLRLAAGYYEGNSSAWTVDEIRIADTWQEALPFLPLDVTAFSAGAAAGQWKINWPAAPGFSDSVEWSPDLVQWFGYPASLRVNGPVPATGEYITPAESPPRRFFRVRREY